MHHNVVLEVPEDMRGRHVLLELRCGLESRVVRHHLDREASFLFIPSPDPGWTVRILQTTDAEA